MGTNHVQNVVKMSRVVSFAKLPFIKSCSPADIDFVIEVGDRKKYLIGEFKEAGKDLTVGQRILIERHVQAFDEMGYHAAGFFAWHDTSSNESGIEVIDAASAVIVETFDSLNKSWVWQFDFHHTLFERYVRFFDVGDERRERGAA
jgi:hypothetical protein